MPNWGENLGKFSLFFNRQRNFPVATNEEALGLQTLHCQCTLYKEGNWLYMTIGRYDRNKRIHWFCYLYLKMTNTTQSWTTMRAMFSRLEISQSTQRQRSARIVAQTSLQFRVCTWKLIFLFLIQNKRCGYSENRLDKLVLLSTQNTSCV